jgi:hypothetical protein
MRPSSALRTLIGGCLLALAAAKPLPAEDRLFLGTGVMHLRQPPRFGYVSAELNRISPGGWFGGYAALDYASNDTFIGAGGLVRFDLGRGANLLVGTGPGVCSDHAAANLGFRFQYRSSATLCWKLAGRRSLAISCSHYSNGGMSRRNPGVEGVRLLYGTSF